MNSVYFLMMHVVFQEQENDQFLDGGQLGPERRLYLRELVARFGHRPIIARKQGLVGSLYALR